MDIFFLFGLFWAGSGFVAACLHGKPGLWRGAIWLGPITFLLFPPGGWRDD